MPAVLSSLDVARDRYAEICPYCDDKRINFYIPAFNEIWVLPDSDIGVLVHEYVHFIQVKYLHADASDPSAAFYEEEAITVQNLYRRELSLSLSASRSAWSQQDSLQ